MIHAPMPRPVISSAPLADTLRRLAEECSETLGDTDNDGTNALGRASVTLRPVAIPQGFAVIRCAINAKGEERVTVTFRRSLGRVAAR